MVPPRPQLSTVPTDLHRELSDELDEANATPVASRALRPCVGVPFAVAILGMAAKRKLGNVRTQVQNLYGTKSFSLVTLRGRCMKLADRWADILCTEGGFEAPRSTRSRLSLLAWTAVSDQIDDTQFMEEFVDEFRACLPELGEAATKRLLKDWHDHRTRALSVRIVEAANDGVSSLYDWQHKLRKATTPALHREAARHNWDDGHFELFQIAAHPKCALATASLIYWRSEPGVYGGLPWDAERRALAKTVEANVQRGRYAGKLSYDPAKDRGWSAKDKARRMSATPKLMHFAVKSGKPVAW